MAHPYYNRRDLIGHWVKKKQPTQRMCTHACCRGRRVHPKNYPVILPDKLLRRATDKDLAAGFNAGGERRRAQILAEMDRRDAAEKNRAARKDAARARAFGRRLERAEEVERAYVEAEDATRGHMVNRAGRANDVDPRSLFTGSEARARRYASTELLNHWESHHRPTAAAARGADTRIAYHDPGTRRRRARAHPYAAARRAG